MSSVVRYLSTIAIFWSTSYHAQLSIKEADFNQKNVLSQIFKGSYQEETNAQKWAVSAVQSLEMNSYVDVNRFTYTVVDTIHSLRIDTSDVKIVVFKTMAVDSIGAIQDFFSTSPQIGVAYFVKNKQQYELTYFKLNLLINGIGISIPRSQIKQIGPSRHALVFTEEVRQDLGREFWYELSENFNEFLEYPYLSNIQGKKAIIIENTIDIVRTENDYFDFILNSKRIPVDDYGTDKAKKIQANTTKLTFDETGFDQHIQFPRGYNIKK